MKKQILRLLGGSLIALMLLASTAYGAAVTISINGITNRTGSALPSGSFVQVIQSSDATKGAPGTNGLPAGDTVVANSAMTGAGTFSGGASITSSNYIYVRAWEGWNGTGNPPVTAYYGDSTPGNVGTGFVFNYTPAGFSTNQPFGDTIGPTMTFNPTTGSTNVSTTQNVVITFSEAVNTGSLAYTMGPDPGGRSVAWSGGNTIATISHTAFANSTSYTVTVTAVTDVAGNSYTGANSTNFTTAAGVTPPNITTTSLPAGTVGAAYSQTVQATGGTTPYTWSISAGTLPAGLSLNASTGVISGTPTTAQTANFTVQVSGGGTDTQALSIVINNGGGGGLTIAPTSAYIGQTIVITGTGFGATPSTITIGGQTARPTAWSDTSITVAVPSGATSGAVVVGAQNGTFTLSTGGVVIDDVEGGSVGTWAPAPITQSGYYTYGSGVTPDNSAISTSGPQASAVAHGTRGMQIMYSFTSGWGGGWGARLANTLDLSGYSAINLFVSWDGSSNDMKVSLKDSDGTSFAATVSNVTLMALSGYGQITLSTTAFSYDVDGSDAGSNTSFNWAAVTNYNIGYPTTGTSSVNQYIDSVTAGTVDLGPCVGCGGPIPPVTGEVVVTQVVPAVGPAGTQFSAIGTGFGTSRGTSSLVFENNSTRVLYLAEVTSWSNTSIEAIVPRLAPIGSYTLKVIKRSIGAGGTMQAFESNPMNFRVTANNSGSGQATVYPNPFNPLSTQLVSGLAVNAANIAYDSTGIQNVGIYIYDSTARLVYHTATPDSQISWDGKDNGGAYVADGVYLLRVINEETRGLIAKAKLVVLKK